MAWALPRLRYSLSYSGTLPPGGASYPHDESPSPPRAICPPGIGLCSGFCRSLGGSRGPRFHQWSLAPRGRFGGPRQAYSSGDHGSEPPGRSRRHPRPPGRRDRLLDGVHGAAHRPGTGVLRDQSAHRRGTPCSGSVRCSNDRFGPTPHAGFCLLTSRRQTRGSPKRRRHHAQQA